jgi:hypothetical protein
MEGRVSGDKQPYAIARQDGQPMACFAEHAKVKPNAGRHPGRIGAEL